MADSLGFDIEGAVEARAVVLHGDRGRELDQFGFVEVRAKGVEYFV